AEVLQVARDGRLGGREPERVQVLEDLRLVRHPPGAPQLGQGLLARALPRRHAPPPPSAWPSRVTATSISASVTTSGGASRSAVPVTGVTTSPRSSAALATH